MNVTNFNYKQELKDLYVVAPIFNPAKFKKRYDLYYKFEQHILSQGINLITIECKYKNQEYVVTNPDNKNHIQVEADHPLWHKENLINYAVSQLPANWKYVLWLDTDIEFIEYNWVEKIVNSFQNYDIIQVFKHANFLGPQNQVLETHYSLGFAFVHDLPIVKKYYSIFYPHPGYGWGMTRTAYEDLGGLIDFSILGSGDSNMAYSLINRYEESFCFPIESFHSNYIEKVKKWQDGAFKYYNNKRFGYCDITINHYFHGFREDRKYVERMKILINNKFDPVNDLHYKKGILHLNKENKDTLILEIENYFNERKEDEINTDISVQSLLSKYKSPVEILMSAIELKNKLEKEKSELQNQESNKKLDASLNKRLNIPETGISTNKQNDYYYKNYY